MRGARGRCRRSRCRAAASARRRADDRSRARSSRRDEPVDRATAVADRHRGDGRTPTPATSSSASSAARVDGLDDAHVPGPELLVPGMRVAVAAHAALDLAQRTHVVVDGVQRARAAARASCAPARRRPATTCTGSRAASSSPSTRRAPSRSPATPSSTVDRAVDRDVERRHRAAARTWRSCTRAASDARSARQRQPHQVPRRVVVPARRSTTIRRAATRTRPPGITTAVYVDDPSSDRDGAIVDADIELNGVELRDLARRRQTLGTATVPGGAREHADPRARPPARPRAPVPRGRRPAARRRPRPARAAVLAAIDDPAITEATMYNFQDCGETKKATLEAEDVAAVCGIYPPSEDPGTCEPVEPRPRAAAAPRSATCPRRCCCSSSA